MLSSSSPHSSAVSFTYSLPSPRASLPTSSSSSFPPHPTIPLPSVLAITPSYPSSTYHPLPPTRLPSSSVPTGPPPSATPASPSDSDLSSPSSPSSPPSPRPAPAHPSTTDSLHSSPLSRPGHSRTLSHRPHSLGLRTKAISSRLRLYQSQQRSDGVYCVLSIVSKPKEEEREEEEEEQKRPAQAEALDASSDSSSDTSDSSSSSSSASTPTSKPPSRVRQQSRRQQRRRVREDEAARLKRLKARAAAPQCYVLNKHGATFGKQSDAVEEGRGRIIEVDDGYVSKKHFTVWGERGRWYVQDLGSFNGTFVRRRRERAEGEGGGARRGEGLDVDACVMGYGYGYEHSMAHGHAGYRLLLHRVFVMGRVEMMVVRVMDEESAEEEGSQDHEVLVVYTAAPSSPTAAPPILTATITRTGATIGSSPSCTIPLSDPDLLPHHASITYTEGRFYLTEPSPTSPFPLPSPPSTGVWSRLSLRSEPSPPHLLCHGDLLRAGLTDFAVSIRAIPPSRAGGYGAGTSGPLPTPHPAHPQPYDIGTSMEPNFLHTKEMQDRIVCIQPFAGGEANAFFAVFDGHQERAVADFAAAALHHNLLEEIAVMRKTAGRAEGVSEGEKSGEGRSEKGGEKCGEVSKVGMVASTTQNDALYGEDSVSSRSRQGRTGRHRRTDSDHSEARVGSCEDDDEEGDGPEVSASARRPPLSISIHHDPASTSGTSPSSASSDSTVSQKPPSTPPPSSSSSLSLDLPLALTRAYRRTSTQIRGLSESALYSGSTSVTALLYRHPPTTTCPTPYLTLTVANLGDSHVYLLTRTSMQELSYPHSARDPLEQARVKAAGGRITQNHRLAGCLEVTRAFGDVGLMGFGLSDEPWVKEVRVGEEERWLVVCSDGVDVMGVKELEEVVREGEREGLDADEVAKEMVERALRRKSRDNISVIVVNLHPRPPSLPSPRVASSLSPSPLMTTPVPPSHSSSSPPAMPSPRHQKLQLTLSPPTHAPDAVSSARLTIVTESLHWDGGMDHLSNSAPAVDGDGVDGREAQSQPQSGGQWEARKESGWAHETQVDEEEEAVNLHLLLPPPLAHSVSSPVPLSSVEAQPDGKEEEKV